jgi:murein DD-endopeptidase MepM/ murein hydrolase activator NlpD
METLRPKQRLMVFVNRWFPDRQLLLRGPGRYSVLNLSQRLQLVAAGTMAFTACWLASASISFIVNYHTSHQAALTTAQLRAALAADDAKIAALNTAYASVAAQRDAQVAQAQLSSSQAVARADEVVATNATALGELIDQTQISIHQVRTIIKATGLDPDRLARQAEPGAKHPELASLDGLTPDNISRATALLGDIHRLEGLTTVLAQVPLTAPVEPMSISSPFGYRPDPWTGAREFHVGIDLRGPIGSPVSATAPGTVTFAGYSNGYGELVVIDHGFGLSTRYSHLDKIMVQVGSTVKLHQEIGLLGNTGWSTGPHLLYETRVDGTPENPLNFIKVASNDVQN